MLVHGSVSDNGDVKGVMVNGQAAKLDAASGQWEITIQRGDAAPLEITARGEDVAGNVEQLPHRLKL